MITGIIAALPEELSILTAKKLAKGSVARVGDNILVIYSGAGAENARLAAEFLLKQGANQLISWGCAAALKASFKPGDLVLANCCVDADKAVVELNNKDWVNAVNTLLANQLTKAIFIGKLAESKTIVATCQDKTMFADETGAIAVDMESVAIAKVAQEQHIPFLSIRAIADPLAMDLPKAISHALNDEGDVEMAKLMVYLIGHPAELPGLVKLGWYFNAAKKTLKQVAVHLAAITLFVPPTTAAN